MSLPLPDPESLQWNHVLGAPRASGRLRVCPEDFRVDEDLGFAPDGSGEHLMLRVRKREANTEWVARRLADVAGIGVQAVGFAGLKDRHALTTQWFSLQLAKGSEPDWSVLAGEGIDVLESGRDRHKLQRGELAGNRFVITLRGVVGDRADLERRLAEAGRGVPNYFGGQRFGRDGGNLRAAAALLAGGRVADRHKRGIYLSAARSMLFNRVLSARVADGSWRGALPGEALMPVDSDGHLVLDAIGEKVAARVVSGDLLPSGPMWGKGAPIPRGEALKRELAALAGLEPWQAGLERAGLSQERRALVSRPEEFAWEWPAADVLRLSFYLRSGAYATTVLREILDTGETDAGEK